eukprot:scaffold11973_cov125-Skeletonema_dohrnii-CCMP3373.AAC.4
MDSKNGVNLPSDTAGEKLRVLFHSASVMVYFTGATHRFHCKAVQQLLLESPRLFESSCAYGGVV